MRKMPAEIYTEGSCWPNPGPGGWAYLIRDEDGQERSACGHVPHTTNNRVELQAIIEALKALPTAAPATLHTDSRYALLCIRKAEKGRYKPDCPNVDLLHKLSSHLHYCAVTAKHVRGHTGHVENEFVDRLAGAARNNEQAGT